MKFIPLKDFMVIRKVDEYTARIVTNVDPTGEEVFEVLSTGPEVDRNEIKKGDYICLVGYLQHVKFKGEKAILARAKDAIVKIKEG